jgi:hypothetical protein
MPGGRDAPAWWRRIRSAAVRVSLICFGDGGPHYLNGLPVPVIHADLAAPGVDGGALDLTQAQPLPEHAGATTIASRTAGPPLFIASWCQCRVWMLSKRWCAFSERIAMASPVCRRLYCLGPVPKQDPGGLVAEARHRRRRHGEVGCRDDRGTDPHVLD